MFKIVKKEKLAENLYWMDIAAPLVAQKAMPGQFVILRVHDRGERIPLTIADYDRKKGIVTIIFQAVGKTTILLATKEQGGFIQDFVGPLGTESKLDGFERVLCIGGGVGIAPLYPQVKYLFQKGTHVDVILGAKSKEYIILEEQIRKVAHDVYITTDDGSYGQKGFVTDAAKALLDAGHKYDHVIAIGPLIMMKMVSKLTKEYGISTTVSMNPIMIDGTGMCGGCRVTVGGQVKYACVDGPDFDGHLVDFDEAMRRQSVYKDHEKSALDSIEHRGVCR
ncbi:MAG TPA: sulfide/dihydroorotate dehydrogenase-like FAD/NAD-binding protein [Clostridiales bacterium]|nr:sulfide/dihydroorotate dehydrogenase-like FAD/NAD-binding protein [Clostridiales bacterium]